jgi:RNA-binding protein
MLGLWNKETISDSEGATFEKKRLRRLQSRSRATESTVWIGKDGPSKEVMKHVSNQLRARELVKLKVQRSALAETEITLMAQKVAESTGSTVIDVMGHTFTLYKKREKNRPTSAR